MSPRRPPPVIHRAAQPGFSLVELLVAIAVGAIVVLGLVDVLINSRVSYVREDQFARLQETGRYAVLTLAKRLRSNRSLDCENLAMHQFSHSLSVDACSLLVLTDGESCNAADVDLTADHLLTPERALGYDATQADTSGWLADLPQPAYDDVAANHLRGDVLVTWGVSGAGTRLTEVVSWDSDPEIRVAEIVSGLAAGSLALVSDCSGADLFEITETTDSTTLKLRQDQAADAAVNASSSLSRAYSWHAADTTADPDSAGGDPTDAGTPRTDAGRKTAGPIYQARVYPFQYSVYYICCVDNEDGGLSDDPGDCNDAPDVFRPSLCVWDSSGGRDNQSLVLDVADMRLTYSGDSDGDWVTDFFADDTDTIHTAQWVSENNAWPGVSGVTVELLVASGRDGVRATPGVSSPAKAMWPPNGTDSDSESEPASDGEAKSDSGSDGIDGDTLGAGLDADRRLYERFVMSVALRSRIPWYLPD